MSPPPCVVLSAEGCTASVSADVTGEQRGLISATTLSATLWCSVMPSVQQIIARSDLAY